ncbi:MAG: DUF5110 domain-containing protein [Planctomycetes bacterium]|nr:DUF5110 domain-containing protein [Planctomycetota bacterium]
MPFRSAPALAVLTASLAAQVHGDLTDMRPIEGWVELAHGVHAATIGKADGERRYSDLAAAPPRLDALVALPGLPLATALQQARARVHADGRISVRIPTLPGERIFGFGLQFDRTLQSHRILELKVDHFNKGGGRTHAPVPFYVSSRGYGVLFDTARYLKVYVQVGNRRDSPRNPPEVDRNPPSDEPQPGPWLAQPPGDAVEASLHAEGLRLVAFAGANLRDTVARYNLFAGGGAMPPLWGLGFWHRTPAKYSAAEVEREIAEFKAHDIPVDVIGLEPGWQTKSYPCTFEWQPKRFPDPQAFTARLLEQGIRLNLWVNPYVSQQAPIYPELLPLSGSHLVWLGIVPDYTLAAARRVLLEQHRRAHFDIGISGYKVDEVDGYDQWLWPDHATFPSGTAAETMRQIYGMQLQQMLQRGLFEPGDRRTWSLVRASNGAASAHPFAIYSDSYGHAEYVTGLSSASFAGVLWCPEIRSADGEREWINRMHTACLSPLAQLNAWASGTRPWSFPAATDAIRRTIRLRMRLLPYLYTAFARYHFDGIPPIGSTLLMTDQAGTAEAVDPAADGEHFREDNSLFCFGPDILVAPFLDDFTERRVRLPAGTWFDFHTGERAGGGEAAFTVTAQQTGDLPPMFVRDGALIPMLAAAASRTRAAVGGKIELRHYGTAPGRCRLYEDDGATFAYRHGAYRLRELATDDGGYAERTLHDASAPLWGTIELRRMTAEPR